MTQVDRPNILLICSDQHQRSAVGCYGHAVARTPNIDRLATGGRRFSRAYCNSPICGPSRISFMTGRYVHDIGMWCNGVPWDGAARTWAYRLTEAGYRTISRGKMDVPGPHGSVGFANFCEPIPRSAANPWPLTQRRVFDDPNLRFDGFMDWPRAGSCREHLLDLHGLQHDRLHVRDERGVYCTGYYDHDRLTTDEALDSLRRHGRQGPWAMHVGLVQPHWPFVCPQEFLDLYPPESIELPADFRRPNESLHPALRQLQRVNNDYRAIEGDPHLRQILAAYYGMATCMDRMVGELLDEIDRQGLAQNTYVIYVSDHGEGGGEHGLFDKLTPYEASVAVPLVIRGPGIAAGSVCDSLVSLVDLYTTILDCARLVRDPSEHRLPGRSLLATATCEGDTQRSVFSEYHGIFLQQSWYMLLRGRHKYVHYVGQRPAMFDLASDPHELHDLHAEANAQQLIRQMESELRMIVDIEGVASRAARELAKQG